MLQVNRAEMTLTLLRILPHHRLLHVQTSCIQQGLAFIFVLRSIEKTTLPFFVLFHYYSFLGVYTPPPAKNLDTPLLHSVAVVICIMIISSNLAHIYILVNILCVFFIPRRWLCAVLEPRWYIYFVLLHFQKELFKDS